MVDKGKSVALRTDPVVIEALAEHTATVIFIHGLSDTPDVLLRPVEHWRGNGQLDHVKFVLPYAPVIAFTAVPLIESFKEHVPEDNASKETPIFLGHGIEDRMVTLGLAKKSQDALTAMGFEISWDVYPLVVGSGLGHATCEDELDDVEAFIDENLS
ncbi:phospholipase/Carboxylesterase [Trichoderma harzianum]|uniref:Acyl-protein thioesterase 1 n=1 Tax=Trichoderma harzianum TaxID=5544 RepID=A0A0G0AF91_TRIHA|nr:phospholipase/Carboxylesterase [Trichoderma harzianum]